MIRLAPRWRKVIRDLWLNKTRTSLVVFSIAVGVFAVGVIVNARIVLANNLTQTYRASNPAHATILTLTAFNDDLVEAVSNLSEVESAEARRSVVVRLQTKDDEWKNLQLQVIADYHDMLSNDERIAKVRLLDGVQPPGKRQILIERSALSLTGAQVGDIVTIKTPSGKIREVEIAGLTHDLQASLYVLGGIAYGHISLDMLEWLGEPRNFNELHVRVAGDPYDRDYVKQVVDSVQNKVETAKQIVLFTFTIPPDQPPADYLIQAILAILGAVGVLALALSSFLVINTISAILTQQVRQIGIMKTIGANTRQLLPMYLVHVLMFGLLALVIALPLGAASAYFFTIQIAIMLNFDIVQFQIPPLAFTLQLAIAILVPFLAGLSPVLAGINISVREAISDQGLGTGRFGNGFIDRFLTGSFSRIFLRWFTRPTLISVRNTFRRKKRLLLTLATLILGGTIFIAVSSLQASLRSTLDSWLEYFQYDVAVQLNRPYRIDRVRRTLQEVPGVVDAEGWRFYTARRIRPPNFEAEPEKASWIDRVVCSQDNENSQTDPSWFTALVEPICTDDPPVVQQPAVETTGVNITIFAPPANTKVVQPTLVRGRLLLPDDDNAIVINTIALRNETDIDVGSKIKLKIEGRDSIWEVVGIVQGGTLTPTGFINYSALSRRIGQIGRAEWMMVITEEHTPAAQETMSRAIVEHLTAAGIRVGITGTASQDRQTIEILFQIIFALLLVVAIVLAIVGGLGLMGTMSINVLERTREIGVMRAVGASNGSIIRIVLFEGMFIGAISWIIGAGLAIPLSRILSDQVGQNLISATLNYTFSMPGLTGWLILVVILASLASFLPAWNASRLTIREVLEYE
ncbi:MAG: FtsX-like permease family protein [Chloroflexota bacterium]